MSAAWRELAACVGKPPQWFLSPACEEIGRATCGGCPVVAECLAEQLEVEAVQGVLPGVYGGTTSKERRVMQSRPYRLRRDRYAS